MTTHGYQRPRANPVSLAAAIAINGAILAALITSAPKLFVPPEKPFVAYPVPEPTPPPPNPEPQPKQVRDRVMSDPLPLPPPQKPIVDLSPIDPGPIGPVDPGPLTGAGGTGVTIDPPPPPVPPVLVDAAPDPRYAAWFQPDYPPAERRAEREGVVTVRVLIGTDGRVRAVESVRATSDAFFAVTRAQALGRWRFRPATRDGVPIESWQTMTVRFVMEV